jgi:hypothetical protein
MPKHILLSLEEVQDLPDEGFLKQIPTLDDNPEEEAEVVPTKEVVPPDEDMTDDKDEIEDDALALADDLPEVSEDGLEVMYLNQEVTCQNPCCQHVEKGSSFHHYEISDETSVTICQPCYRGGYRFCLLTQEVHHISQLKPIWDDMYVHSQYGSLTDYSHVDDMYSYFQMIGIENACPRHYLVKVN